MNKKEWRKHRKDNNLCKDCGILLTNGKATCEVCLEKQRKKRQEKKENGICYFCSRPVFAGGRCKICLETVKKRQEKYNKEGLCSICGQICKNGRKRCDRCASTVNKYKKKRTDDGFCTTCSVQKPRIGYKTCESCKDIGKKRVEKYKKEGLCTSCGKEKLQNNNLCLNCWFKIKSTCYFKTVIYADSLKKIFEKQDGVCPYTGTKLIIGTNAEIDHIIPKALGGKDELENMQWVLDKVNKMKWDMPESDFLDMIKTIYNNLNK